MKKSELKQLIKEFIHDLGYVDIKPFSTSLTEADDILNKIGDIAKTTKLVSMRKPLEQIFKKRDIDFSFQPVPHFRINYKGKTILIVNKKYADEAELVIGSTAIGYE